MPDRPCPVCGKPLGDDEVYRAGIEHDNLRTIPPTYGRGEYCDHRTRLVVSPSQLNKFASAGVDVRGMAVSTMLPVGPSK